jgi:alkaline phosphatase D
MPYRDAGRLAAAYLNRRRLFIAGAGLAGGLAASCVSRSGTGEQPQTPGAVSGYPFNLGVASGDPSPDGVVLWTRLAVQPLEPGGGMPPSQVRVDWEVAEDPAMRRVVARGTQPAAPAEGHSIHVEVTGLQPARQYWYRFRAGGELSPVGRTKTLPVPSASPDRLAFAVASCQHWETGYYTAYRHMSADDLDLVFHVGDYIYEGAPRDGRPRRHVGPEPVDLDTYRMRHALYRTDPDLQAAHAAFPFVCTWDDHEVENDYANAQSQDFDDPQAFLRRRAAAYQAYWEHLPLRQSSRPRGPDAQLYRRLVFGNLAEVRLLDTRQYRDDQACATASEGGGQLVDPSACPQLDDPARTILGAQQTRWLLDGLAASSARWNVLTQPCLMAQLDEQPGPGVAYWTDAWDGYMADRRRILQFLQEAPVTNPVVLGGDIHSFWVTDLKANYRDPAAPVVATEFVGTSISSEGVPYEEFASFLPDNPHIKFFDSRLRGYLRCTVGPQQWTSDLRVVDTPTQPGGPARTLATWVVEDGRPGAQQS